jgi:hypothetical protein
MASCPSAVAGMRSFIGDYSFGVAIGIHLFCKYRCAPVSSDSLSTVYRGPEKMEN